ncbi:MAG: threonine synthase [Oscillospiraceae bacterium]|nr:threonine synthase [Oscillospiraceae bacterium]
MLYHSTRDNTKKVTSAQAIVSGLAPDGGLYVPEYLPNFTLDEITELSKLSYPALAANVLAKYLDDYTVEELQSFTEKAYSQAKFAAEEPAPLVQLKEGTYLMELFHGPTCAFKDFALQMLPFLLSAALKKTGETREAVILVATSGDTGKAALEGFADVPGTRICVFYPDGGTSRIQRLQMTTQSGSNVMVYAVKGNFDDTQSGVKKIFTDKEFAAQLADNGFLFSSANSINLGRLVPQIAYYFSAYCTLLREGKINAGDKIDIVVPTGNFGNILAAYYAKHSGLPLGRLICASNKNNVLTEFISTGHYDRRREFFLTASPSMDILISSNLERLLYLLCGSDDSKLSAFMTALSKEGEYTIGAEMLAALQSEFSAGSADDERTFKTIRDTFEKTGYLADTHTAVGIAVCSDYVAETGSDTPVVIASTASPFKFAGSVLPAIGAKEDREYDDFEMLAALEAASNLTAPAALAGLKAKEERFTTVILPDEMKAFVEKWLTNNAK